MAKKLAVFVVLFAVGIYFLRQYMAGGKCESDARIDGKVVLITGANTGIGKVTAIDLARRGGRIIMACRSMERANAAAADVKQAANVGDDKVKVMQLDLSSLTSIRKFAEAYKKQESRLDILINNAGVMWPPYSKTEDGFELTMGVNHLGHFLLTNLLLDTIKKSAPSRIVTVSSMGHQWCPVDFDDLMSEKEYDSMKAYSMSKSANILFTQELAKRLEGTGVTTYSLHPGAIKTELGRHISVMNLPVIRDILNILTMPFLKTPEEGAQTSICCAVDKALENQTGMYYSDCALKEASADATSDANAKRLWDISEEYVGLKPKAAA